MAGTGRLCRNGAGIGEAALAAAIGGTAVIRTPMCTLHPGPVEARGGEATFMNRLDRPQTALR